MVVAVAETDIAAQYHSAIGSMYPRDEKGLELEPTQTGLAHAAMSVELY